MGHQWITERIAAWEAAGLIDAETAARLRAAEGSGLGVAAGPVGQAVDTEVGRHGVQSSLRHAFGPGVAIGEMFGYLGGFFLLGAWDVFAARAAGSGRDSSLILAGALGLAVLSLAIVAVVLRRGDERRRRAAGVVLAVAVGHAAAAGIALASWQGVEWPYVGLIGALAAGAVAVVFRVRHPALVTQAALLAALTSLAAATLASLEDVIVRPQEFSPSGAPLASGGPEPIVLVLAAAAWWLMVALGLGLLGLRESRTAALTPADVASAGRRAALTRLWAGFVATLGLASAVTRSGYDSTTDMYGRILEPWVADLALLVLAAILVERAFRRNASSFVYAAALALLIGLTDFNFSYLSESTETGLLIEGVILLVAGFVADRLRRRLTRPGDQDHASPAAASYSP